MNNLPLIYLAQKTISVAVVVVAVGVAFNPSRMNPFFIVASSAHAV